MKVSDPAKTYTHAQNLFQEVSTGEIRHVPHIEFLGSKDSRQFSSSLIREIIQALPGRGVTFQYRQMLRIQLALLLLTTYDLGYNSTIELEVLGKTEIDIIQLPPKGPKGLLVKLHASGSDAQGRWAELEGVFPVIVSWEGYTFISDAPESWTKEYYLKLRTGRDKFQKHTFLFQLSSGKPFLSTHRDLEECLARAMALDLLSSHAMRLQLNALTQ